MISPAPSSWRRPIGANSSLALIRFSPSPDHRFGEGAHSRQACAAIAGLAAWADEGPSEARVVPLAPPLRFASRRLAAFAGGDGETSVRTVIKASSDS